MLENIRRNYGGFVMNMIVGHMAASISFEELVLLLLQQEAQEKKNDGTNEKALIAQDKRKGMGKGNPGKGTPKKDKSDEGADSSDEDNKKREKERKCFFCGESRHLVKYCRKKRLIGRRRSQLGFKG